MATTEPTEPAEVDSRTFRQALRHHAGGVAVVTAAGGDGPVGFTVTSLTAASLSPPLVSFYVNHETRSWAAMRQAEHFAVHLLGAAHTELAALFARRGADRFAAPTRWRPGPDGVPLLEEATVRLVCARSTVLAVGDHSLVIGVVREVENGTDDDPLLYAHGQFGHWVPTLAGPRVPYEELDMADTVQW